MERRRALVVAGTLTATAALAAGAMAANLGLLGSDAGAVGDLDATTLQPAAAEQPERPGRQRPRVRVIVQDIPVAGGGSAGGSTASATGSPSVESAPAPVVPQPAAPTYVDDDDHDDEVEDHGDDEVEDHGDDEDHEEPDDD